MKQSKPFTKPLTNKRMVRKMDGNIYYKCSEFMIKYFQVNKISHWKYTNKTLIVNFGKTKVSVPLKDVDEWFNNTH